MSSVWHVLGKLALSRGMDASVFMVYRLLLTSLVLFIALRVFVGAIVFPTDKGDIARILLLGGCTFVHSLLFVYGLQMTTPFLCAVMQPSVPVFVWLLSVTMGLEHSTVRKAIGVALCSFGAVGAAAASSHHASTQLADSRSFQIGTILIVIQCVFYAFHLVFQQPLFRTFHPVQVTGMLYLIAGCITCIVTVIRTIFPFSTLPPYWGLSHDPTAWFALAFCVVFASAFTHGIYSWASKRVAPTTVSCFITIEPITTTIVSLIVTRSGLPSLLETLCACTVAMGVVLVLGGKRPPTEDPKYEPVTNQVEEFQLEEVKQHKRPKSPKNAV